MVVSELVTKFSFVGSLTPQKEFNANLKSSVQLLAGVGTALAASAAGFFAWTASVLDGIDPLAQLNRETGVAVESIQELGFVASVNGSSLDAVSGSMRELSKRMGEFVNEGGGPAKNTIEQLGLSMTDAAGEIKTADVVMLELSEKMRGMSLVQKSNILDKMGIDQSMIQTLSLSAEEMAALTLEANRFGVISTEQANSAAAFNDSLTKLKGGMQSIKNQIAVGFAPEMDGLVQRFTLFLEANQELIKDGLARLGDILFATMGFMERMAPIILTLAAAFGVAYLATGGLATIMGVLLSPVVLITAGIVALLLIVDDLLTAFNGGQSVIRDFFIEFFGFDIVPIMKGLVAAFKDMVASVMDVIGPFFEAFGYLFDALISAFTGDFSGAFDSIGKAFGSWTDGLANVFGAFVSGISAAFGLPLVALKAIMGQSYAIISPFIDALGQMFAAVVRVFTGDFSGALNSLKGAFGSWVDGLKMVFGLFVSGISAAFGLPLIALKALMGDSFAVISPIIDAIGQMFSAVVKAFTGDWTGALDSLAGAFASWIDGVTNIFGALFSSITGLWGGVLDLIKSGVMNILPDWAINLIGGDAPAQSTNTGVETPFSIMTPNEAMGISSTSNSSTSNSSVEQQNQINVYANDPQAAGAAVDNALQNQLRTAKTQASRGGR